jgi:hypothetical protein
MSTLKADAVTSAQDNTALTLSGRGTGGVKVNDYLIQTKGSDISSATSLTLGKDGNQFDVTGTTTITSIATQGIGSYVTLHFDGALTFTHHSTDLVLPGAANITTAAGDIAVMYEYASADWRCVSYTKAAGTAVVAAAGGRTLLASATLSGSSLDTFDGLFDDSTYSMIEFQFIDFDTIDSDHQILFEVKISSAWITSGYSWTYRSSYASATGQFGSTSDSTGRLGMLRTTGGAASCFFALPEKTGMKHVWFECLNNDANLYYIAGFCRYHGGDGAWEGIRFKPSTGTWSGVIKMYGHPGV